MLTMPVKKMTYHATYRVEFAGGRTILTTNDKREAIALCEEWRGQVRIQIWDMQGKFYIYRNW